MSQVTRADLPTLPPLTQLNEASEADFNQTVGLFFESAPALGKRLYSLRPFETYPAILEQAEPILLHALSDDEKVSVINAHPRLGTTETGQLSVLSRAEQAGGLPGAPGARPPTAGGSQTVDELRFLVARFDELNRAYEHKYGFRFLIFVDGRTKREILPVFEKRLNHSTREQEMATALKDSFKIAASRLRVLLPADDLAHRASA
ncbi:Oxo-4-hydroxy-4-carboxy-5-ureidoimidazoline decarboxylase [Dimargaris cristalligena]|uniref:2-oxo-4-hydroxy-4-carboxy-5-ureidoimidazoline decarboxylase n=1 Tax=Dimargaris cristalligena TaxID=215637 RepID=A0A4P9ZN53_9FUNG|nr:Oxo-4-hydroxy-4-carboxy-5-ureidoimidazoline decarboxylase [Dimargaris cristalligena]|eukprot:RKP33740.1 Oxo-4-hydroxy-4-carboxy-5-ureidoimidazoline decarboxylase [Dimargaris cristalligena]